MKTRFVCLMSVILVAAVFTGAAFTQDQTEKKQVSQKFLNTWKKVGDKTKEIRSFKTEKATTVAGVRGAEAEDEALKYLYFKGGVKYPSRLELKNAIAILEEFVKENPDDETIPESKYFMAQCYFQLGEADKAKVAFQDLIDNHASSDFSAFAKEEIKNIKN
ncbi:tol-pal system YbgF family protein [candidate division KSB1 bacterium]